MGEGRRTGAAHDVSQRQDSAAAGAGPQALAAQHARRPALDGKSGDPSQPTRFFSFVAFSSSHSCFAFWSISPGQRVNRLSSQIRHASRAQWPSGLRFRLSGEPQLD